MKSRNELIERMHGLCPQADLVELRWLTRTLVDFRDNPGMERNRFTGTKLRGIPGFHPDLLPDFDCIVVTGGTGCVGFATLSRLVAARPGARFVSVARHLPTPRRRVNGVEYLCGDVTDPTRITAILRHRRPDVLVHLAAQRSPSYAEDHVTETVRTNILGSAIVLEAAGRAGVGTVVIASTGKAVRLYTSDVYAATKKLVEYQAAATTKRHGIKVSCTRFTHVVDNSIVGMRLVDWIANDETIALHSPDILLPVQSALECYHLLMVAAKVAGPKPKGLALRDLGWPPVSLLDMTLDYLADAPTSASAINFTGYPLGYEEFAYPGTYDPVTAGDVSPLINAAEAIRTTPADILGSYVDQWALTNDQSPEVDRALSVLMAACRPATSESDMRGLLRSTSVALLQHLIEGASPAQMARVHRLGSTRDSAIIDHEFIHGRLAAHLRAVSARRTV